MRENPDGFPSSRVRLRRRRCSHSGIRFGLFECLPQTTQGGLRTRVSRPRWTRPPWPPRF